LIIDASVALKWLVPEDGSDAARSLLTRIDLTGPSLLHVEVANGLHRKARREEIATTPDLVTLIESLAGVVQTVDDMPLIGRALALASKLSHSVYDCVYLALAEQLGRELVTADLKFFNKVKASDLADLVRPL
jgi:predicted nucleic acid-binding protein